MSNISLQITDSDDEEIFDRFCQKHNQQRMEDLLQDGDVCESDQIGTTDKQQNQKQSSANNFEYLDIYADKFVLCGSFLNQMQQPSENKPRK